MDGGTTIKAAVVVKEEEDEKLGDEVAEEVEEVKAATS